MVLTGAIIAINLSSEQPKIAARPEPPRQEATLPPIGAPAQPPAAAPVPPGGGAGPKSPPSPPTVALPKSAPATYRVLPNVSGGFQNLRSGPAVKYKIVIPIPAGATGIVLGPCRPAEDNTKPCARRRGKA